MNDAINKLNPLYLPERPVGEKELSTVALALVKNEGDIISLWLSHVCELFDHVYIVDHQSTDGTREFLLDSAKSMSKIYLYSFDYPGYYQSEITNHLAKLAGQNHPTSWLFPIDADEFFSVESQEEFRSLLDRQDTEKILVSSWQNCVPQYLYGDQVIGSNFPCFFSSKPSIYNKVAVNSNLFLRENVRFIQGNHRVENDNGKPLRNKYIPFLNLLHLPVRSVEHFGLKCIQGSIAYNQLPLERKSEGQGAHWKDMIDSVLTSGFFEPDIIRKFIVSYGKPNDLNAVNMYTLVDLGWTGNSFSVPTRKGFHSPVDRKILFFELAQKLLEEYPQYTNLHNFLRIIKENRELVLNTSLWQKERKNILVLEKLQEQSKYDRRGKFSQNIDDIDIVNSLFSKAFTHRENRVPSTWEEHIPFLYCLLSFVNPRRFVELGSHYGNCFFAACQMSKLLNNSIECIAIDTWEGDEHAGKYQEDVFRQFSYILHRDYPNGKYIRKLFNDAASQFENGSIDLLHIDGLHTYEAVAGDYQTWLPKLSDQGIIMFHDTQVKERDFGVWKLWADVSKQYPSFEFEHGHGLGVLLVGYHAEPAIQRLFELFARPEYLKFVRFFFSNVGNPHR